MKHIKLLPFFITIFFTSCSKFAPNKAPHISFKESLEVLKGEYEMIPRDNKDSLSLEIFFPIDKSWSKLSKDSLTKFSFALEPLNEKLLKVSYKINGQKINEQILKTRIDRKGYLRILPSKVTTTLIPILFGGIRIYYYRLSTNCNKEIQLDINMRVYANILIFLVDGYDTTDRYTFKRLK